MTALHHRPLPPETAPLRPAEPADARDDTDPAKEPKEPARLSFTQIVASGLAAVSTTVLLSLFGVAGTIIGAGLASVLTVVANFLYTRSIEKTHEQLKPVVGTIQARTATTRVTQQSARRRDTAVLGATTATPPVPGDTTAVRTDAAAPRSSGPATDSATGPTTGVEPPADDAQPTPPPRNAWLRLVERHGRARVLTASAMAVFLVVMGIVVVVELALGKPLSDAVRGQEGTGTSISQLRDSTPTGSGTTDQDEDRPAQDEPAQDGGTEGTTSDGAGEQPQEATTGGAAGTETDDTTTSDPDGTATQEPTTDPTAEPTDPATDGTDGTDDDTATGGTGTGTGDGGDTSTGTGTDTGSGTEDDTSTGDVQPGSSDGTSDGSTGDTGSSGGSTPTPETTGATTG